MASYEEDDTESLLEYQESTRSPFSQETKYVWYSVCLVMAYAAARSLTHRYLDLAISRSISISISVARPCLRSQCSYASWRARATPSRCRPCICSSKRSVRLLDRVRSFVWCICGSDRCVVRRVCLRVDGRMFIHSHHTRYIPAPTTTTNQPTNTITTTRYSIDRSNSSTGVAIGLYCLGQVLSSYLLGIASHRVPITLCILVSLGFDLGGNLLYGLSTNVYMLLPARFLAGIGAGNVAISRAYVSSIFPRAARPTAMGYLATAQAIGFIYGPGTLARAPFYIS